MNLRGRTREQIELLLAKESREELFDRIFSLVTVEQLFKPLEVAARSCVNKRTVLRDIRDGKFGESEEGQLDGHQQKDDWKKIFSF